MVDLPVTHVVIPYRSRGTDPLRGANLAAVLDWWRLFENPKVVDDGREGKELFNRSAAYNRGVALAPEDADVFIFSEADMILDPAQVGQAVEMAHAQIGMVVPFDTYHYHSPEGSMEIRKGAQAGALVPKWRMDDCRSVGAVNVMSRQTLDALGCFDEKFEGSWYDDNALKLALDLLAAPTRFVPGVGHHLYHLPGWRGKHLTDMEKMATRRNNKRLALYQMAFDARNCATMRRLLRGEL